MRWAARVSSSSEAENRLALVNAFDAQIAVLVGRVVWHLALLGEPADDLVAFAQFLGSSIVRVLRLEVDTVDCLPSIDDRNADGILVVTPRIRLYRQDAV